MEDTVNQIMSLIYHVNDSFIVSYDVLKKCKDFKVILAKDMYCETGCEGEYNKTHQTIPF